MKKYGGGGGGRRGAGALKAKHYIFVWGGSGDGGAIYIYIYFFFLAFVKMYNFLQVMVLLKNAVSSNGICWNEKQFLFLEEGSPEKHELCECHGCGVD